MSCLIYLKAPKGYVVEQRSHPIVRFAACDKEQLRFASDGSTLVYCDGSHPLHFMGDRSYVAVMYEGVSKDHRQEITFAVSVKPVAASLPGSKNNNGTGTSEVVWRDPEAEYKPRAMLEQARRDESIQICPGTCGASNQSGAHRLVSPTRAAEGEVPYMVRVTVDYDPPGSVGLVRITCGGSILNSRHVLTAAHCLFDDLKQYWKVLARKVFTADFDDKVNKARGQELDVATFFVHPQYKTSFLDDLSASFKPFDLAVVRLYGDIVLGPNSQTICLAPSLDFIGRHATVSGYGPYGSRPEVGEKNQQSEGPWKSGVVIADYDKKCRALDRHQSPEKNYRKGCSFGMNKESCHGDTGSPVAVSEGSVWYQVGVSSGGFCSRSGEPHFHVNVATFLDFIRKHVEGGSCN